MKQVRGVGKGAVGGEDDLALKPMQIGIDITAPIDPGAPVVRDAPIAALRLRRTRGRPLRRARFPMGAVVGGVGPGIAPRQLARISHHGS